MLKLMENDTIEAHQEIPTNHGHNNDGHVDGMTGDPDAVRLMTLLTPTSSQKGNPFPRLSPCFLSI